MKFAALLAVGFATLINIQSPAFADQIQSVIPAFKTVVPGIYRGGRPGVAGLKELAQLHVKTIINLENDEDVVRDEATNAKAMGFQFFSSPMGPWGRPRDEQVNQVLATLANPSMFPIYVHCKHGEDRTGLIVGLYRVLVQKWPADQAYREMKDNGFHTVFFQMVHYFKEKTGYRGQ